MSLPPDSGDPGDYHEGLGLGKQKPELLTDATWQHINQLYQLRGDLGDGGQGVVLFVKERAAPHRRLAIKVYHENTDSARRLFENECRMLASPYLPADLVVGYFHCVVEPGLQPYLVLEHIDGKPIHEHVAANPRMSLGEKLDLLETLCRSVQRLHECNLVFGDLSANNVMVEKGGRIRFIDLAGAKLLAKGHSLTQSSINIGTPGMLPDAVLTGAARTARWTDIYATAVIGFLILTGKTPRDVFNPYANGEGANPHGSPTPKSAHAVGIEVTRWDAELAVHHVPRAVSKLILKGLREPAPSKLVDSNLYPEAKHLADDLAGWKRSIERRRHCVLVAALLLIVALPGAWGWLKWNEARQASDLVASRRMIADLQQQVGQLVTREHAAVKKLIGEAGQAARQLDEAQSRGQSLSDSVKLANDVRFKLRQALELGQGIERGSQQRAALGSVLLEQDRVSLSGFWATDAPTIRQRLTDLQSRYVAIGKRLDAGDLNGPPQSISIGLARLAPVGTRLVATDGDAVKLPTGAVSTATGSHEADNHRGKPGKPDGDLARTRGTPDGGDLATALAELQRDLVALFEDNLLARQALQVRARYEREKRSIAERVQKLEGFVDLHKTAVDGEQEFQTGDFKSAATNYGRAVDRLTDYLQRPNIETAEEQSNRQRVTADLVKTLESDKAQLQSRIGQLTGDIDTHTKTISGLQTQIAHLSAKQLKDQDARAVAENKLAAVEPKIADFDRTKAALAKATTELAATQKSLTERQAKLRDLEPQLVTATAGRETEKKRADAADEQVRQLIAAAERGNEDSLRRAQEIAALNTKIAQVDTKQLKQAEEAFAAAWENYVTVLGVRDQFVANDKPKPTSKILEEKNKDVAVAQAQMEAAFEKREAAYVVAFNVTQPDVTQAEKKLEEARAEYEDGSPKLDKPKQTLATAKAAQQPFAAAAARASDAGKKLAMNEIVALAGTNGLFPVDGGRTQGGRLAGLQDQELGDALALHPTGQVQDGEPPWRKGPLPR